MNTTNKVLIAIAVGGGAYWAYNYYQNEQAKKEIAGGKNENNNPIPIIPPANPNNLPKSQYVVGKDKATLFFTPYSAGASHIMGVKILNSDSTAVIEGNVITFSTTAFFENENLLREFNITEIPAVEINFGDKTKIRREADLTKMIKTDRYYNKTIVPIKFSVTNENLVKAIYEFGNNDFVNGYSRTQDGMRVTLKIDFYVTSGNSSIPTLFYFEQDFYLSQKNVRFNWS